MSPGTSRGYGRGARRGAAILAALGSFALGCSSILGIADGIGYLGGDGGLADGSAPADGPGPPDAPFDSAPVDASGPPDAALDAGVDAAGCDANLATDTHNCGACGHDCLGTPCEQSQCQPVAIVTGQDNPLNISVDALNVYWTNNDEVGGSSSVSECPKSGCTNTTPVLGAASNAWGVVATGAGVYLTQDQGSDAGEVDLVPPLGVFEQLQVLDTPKWIAADANDVYFTANGDTALYACPLGASSCSAPAILTDTTDTLEDVAALGGIAYVTFLSGVVESISASGQNKALIYQDSAGIFSIAVDANNVYYTNPQTGTVTQQCLAGGCSLVLASAQARPWRIAVDAATVYWTDIIAGKVLACPIGGSCGTNPAAIASVQTAPWGIAVDDTRVYWTTHVANGAVMSVVK